MEMKISNMKTKYILDTHALVWFLEGNPRLGASAKAVLENENNELILPIVALAEACWIIEHGKTSIPNLADFLIVIDDDPRIQIIPLDRPILDKTLSIYAIDEMHDRQIIATALTLADSGENVAVLTKDANIRLSGLVSIVWE